MCIWEGRVGWGGTRYLANGPSEVSRSSLPGLAYFYSGSALMRKQLRVEVGEDRPLHQKPNI